MISRYERSAVLYPSGRRDQIGSHLHLHVGTAVPRSFMWRHLCRLSKSVDTIKADMAPFVEYSYRMSLVCFVQATAERFGRSDGQLSYR